MSLNTKTPTKQKVNVWIPDVQLKKLRKESKRSGNTVAELVRRSIENYTDNVMKGYSKR